MVEHAAVNRGVEGSSPSSGAIFSPSFPVSRFSRSAIPLNPDVFFILDGCVSIVDRT